MMPTAVEYKDVKPLIRWLLGGLNGWYALMLDSGCVNTRWDASELERLERTADQINELVYKQKSLHGMSRDSKTY